MSTFFFCSLQLIFEEIEVKKVKKCTLMKEVIPILFQLQLFECFFFFSYFLLFFISRAKSLGPHLQIYIMITSNIKEVHICTIATTVILTVIEQQSFSFGYGPMTTSSLSMMMITVIECIINWRQISSFQFCARKKGHIVKNLKKKNTHNL